MIRDYLLTTDANGNSQGGTGPGIHYLVAQAGANPGSYPVMVQKRGGLIWTPDKTVDGPTQQYGQQGEEFDQLFLVNGLPNATYRVYVATELTDRMEGTLPSRSGVVAKSTDAGQALGAAATNPPTLATQGIALAGLAGYKLIITLSPGSIQFTGGFIHWWDYDPDRGIWDSDPSMVYAVNGVNNSMTFPEENEVTPYGRRYAEFFNVTANGPGTGNAFIKGISR